MHEEEDKLDILINCITPNVYDYIAMYITFESAVNYLKEFYMKSTNEIFTRYILATHRQRQEEEEDIAEYVQGKLLVEKCKTVNGAQTWDDCIKDALISSLHPNTRQHLLENRTSP